MGRGRPKGSKDLKQRKIRGGRSASVGGPAANSATLNNNASMIPESLLPNIGWTNMNNSTAELPDLVFRPEDIVADFDDDDQLDIENAPKGGVMDVYLDAISKRLKKEVNSKIATDQWLMTMIKAGDWWLHPRMAKTICKKLGLTYDEPYYYRAIHVWLPHKRWDDAAMPPCVSCQSADNVSPHDFPHAARRVVGLKTNYYVMSQRYICSCCKDSASQATARIHNALESQNLSIEGDLTTRQYTFMGYDPRSVLLLPYGYGKKYPAFHMHKSAVCMDVVKLLRPLHNGGFRSNKISKLLLELHSGQYTDDHIEREEILKRDSKLNPNLPKTMGMFSPFNDNKRYDDHVPKGKYLERVYKKLMASIETHLNNEVKKRGAERLHWDASYKEAKHLGQFHGKPIFKALITATNEVGEIRVQFHVVTDGHDQMKSQIAALLDTLRVYNQPQPMLLTTDKPSDDKPFFLENIKSLKDMQITLDSGIPALPQSNVLTDCTVDIDKDVRVCGNSTTDAENRLMAIRGLVKVLPPNNKAVPPSQCIMGFDIEWNVHKNDRGFIEKGSPSPVALIQLSYKEKEDGQIKAVLITMNGGKTLGKQLLKLLTDPDITFVGRGIKGDKAKLGKDFNCIQQLENMKIADIGTMASACGIIKSTGPTLERLVELVLEEKLDKDPNVRISDKWSSKNLSAEQIKYAALDAIKGHEIYLKLAEMPVLTTRLSLKEATVGLVVDIVPSSGTSMATCAAIAEILPREKWSAPEDICKKSSQNVTDKKCLVKITRVLASAFVVPNVKRKDGKQMTLGDFGEAPFQVMLPLSMVRPHSIITERHLNIPDINLMDVIGHDQSAIDIDMDEVLKDDSDNDDGGIVDDTSIGVEDSFYRTLNQIFDELLDERNDRAMTAIDDLCDDYDDFNGLTVDEISKLRAAVAAGTNLNKVITSSELKKKLGDIPETIVDRYSSVLGDLFHLMDRCKVPMHHEAKKGYYVALRQAFFQWDTDKLAEVISALRDIEGKSDADIEAMMYYNVDYFRQRVPRIVLPPSLLYPRVRAVFELYGQAKDSETDAPLFNNNAWKAAKNVLKEILAGLASDPPGISFYSHRLNSKGELAYDNHGIALLNCSRGSNDTESAHKQFITTFGTWNTGVHMADCLMAEWRHRHNQGVSERRRLGFPRIGHYDTWLIDHLQKLIQHNHGVIYYPDWSNASDHVPTGETFGTVPIHSAELAAAIEGITLPKPLSEYKFTEDQQYLCKTMNVKIPLLPLVSKEEYQLFNLMMASRKGTNIDFDAMAIEWCEHVDALHVFPKLAVYLRTHHRNWSHNQRVRDSVAQLKPGEDMLRELNARYADSDVIATSTTPAQAVILLPPTMPQPPDILVQPEGGIGVAVGGTIIGGAPPTRQGGKRQHGNRGKDEIKRKARRCKYCIQNGKSSEIASKCPGNNSKRNCTGGPGGASLHCINCNSSTKCGCSFNKK